MVEATPCADGVDVDVTFDVLSSRRRRTVLGLLSSKIEPVSIEELVDTVHDAESPDRARPDDHRYGIATSLHHVHLPKLAKARMIDVDAERGLITPRVAVVDAEPYLALARADERRNER